MAIDTSGIVFIITFHLNVCIFFIVINWQFCFGCSNRIACFSVTAVLAITYFSPFRFASICVGRSNMQWQISLIEILWFFMVVVLNEDSWSWESSTFELVSLVRHSYFVRTLKVGVTKILEILCLFQILLNIVTSASWNIHSGNMFLLNLYLYSSIWKCINSVDYCGNFIHVSFSIPSDHGPVLTSMILLKHDPSAHSSYYSLETIIHMVHTLQGRWSCMRW